MAPSDPLPPAAELRDEALRILRSIALAGRDDEARVAAAVAILDHLQHEEANAMMGKTYETKTGSVSVSRKSSGITITVRSAAAVAAEELTPDDARDLAAELLELADAPAPQPVDRGHVEPRDLTPREEARVRQNLPKPGSGDPS